MKNSFSSTLRDLRNAKNLSQSQLATQLGTTQRKVSYWESGKIEPDLDSLITLAEFFETTVDYLLGRSDF